MKLVIGNDRAALDLKNHIKKYLEQTRNIEIIDVGINENNDETFYPKVAKKVVDVIKEEGNNVENGILICGTGIGMALSANKFKGIRAAVCHDIYSAERAKKSNNTNIMTMGARVVGFVLAQKIVDMWLDSEFKGGRSAPKVAIIDEFEEENFSRKR